jgi:WD40 repeat protein
VKASRFHVTAAWGRAAWKAPAPTLGLAISSDGTWALTGHEDWTMRCWDLARGHIVAAYLRRSRPQLVAIAPAGDRIASAGDARDPAIVIVELPGERTSRIDLRSVAMSLAFSPDGKRLVSGHWDGKVRIHDLAAPDEPRTLAAHRPETRVSAAFTCDGLHVVSGSDDGTLKLWEPGSSEPAKTLSIGAPVSMIAPSPTEPDEVLVGTHDGGVSLWSLEQGRATLGEHVHHATSCVAFAPDGKTFASGGDGGGVAVVDAERHLNAIAAHRTLVTRLAFTPPDGKRLVTTSLDQTIGLFAASSGADLRDLSGHGGWVMALTPLPSGERVLSGGTDGFVHVWDVATGRTLPLTLSHETRILTIAVTPDGRRALTGTLGGVATLWDLDFGRHLGSIAAVAGPPSLDTYVRLAISPDGKRAISNEGRGAIAAWELEPFSRRPLRLPGSAPPGTRGVAFLPDGRALTGSVGGELLVWDLDAGTSETISRADSSEPGVMALAVLPDGKSVLAAMGSGAVRLWDLERRRVVRSFEPGAGLSQAEALALAPDGKSFAVAHVEGSVQHWDVASSSVLDRIEMERAWDGAQSLAWLDARTLLVGMFRGEILRFSF